MARDRAPVLIASAAGGGHPSVFHSIARVFELPATDKVRMPFLTVVSKKNIETLEASARTRRTVLESFGPVLVKIMRAERGFIRLFPEDDLGSNEDLGVAGLSAGDSIGISENAFMRRLLAGRFVRDGNTLLVPLLHQGQTIGFFCLDGRCVPTPFTDDDGHFLMGIGQAAMTLRDVPATLGGRVLDGATFPTPA